LEFVVFGLVELGKEGSDLVVELGVQILRVELEEFGNVVV